MELKSKNLRYKNTLFSYFFHNTTQHNSIFFMKKEALIRQFSFSDGTLKQYADQMVLFAHRDSAEFAARGYSATRLTTIAQQANDFGTVTSDEEMLALQMLRTEVKDKNRDALEDQLRTIFAMANNFFGSKSIQLRRFGDVGLSKQADNDLVRTARICIKTATEYLSDLASEGLTAAILATATAQTKALDEALDVQQLAISDREIAKETRIETANALYSEIAKLANTGKSIFRTTNEAKYNDYVIYDTPSGKNEDPPKVTP